MEVILRSVNRRVKKPIIKDHYWYDPETKQRLHGRGGKMIFVYDPGKKKSIPRIVDSEEWVLENSYEDIITFLRKKGITIVNETPGHFVVINVNAQHWGDIEDDLYRHKIPYDYDTKELHKETRGEKWQNSISKLPIHPWI